MEAGYDRDGAVVFVELDGVGDEVEEDLQEEVPVRVGPAGDLIALDDFHFNALHLELVVERLQEVQD